MIPQKEINGFADSCSTKFMDTIEQSLNDQEAVDKGNKMIDMMIDSPPMCGQLMAALHICHISALDASAASQCMKLMLEGNTSMVSLYCAAVTSLVERIITRSKQTGKFDTLKYNSTIQALEEYIRTKKEA